MDIREFVAAALTEVLDGVRDAQRQDDGKMVNAALGDAKELGGNLFRSQFGVCTRIDFDLAVTAETKHEAGGEAKLTVVGVGFGGKGSHASSTHSVSRIAFSVPVQIPDGDQSRLQRHQAITAASKAQDESQRRDRFEKLGRSLA